MQTELPFIEILTNFRYIPFQNTTVNKYENYGNPESADFWITRGDSLKHQPPILKFKPRVLTLETDLQQHLMEGCIGILLPANGRVKLVPIETGPVVDYVILRNF